MTYKLKIGWLVLVIMIFTMVGCRISGTISDNGVPLEGVTVTLNGSVTLTATTNSSGVYKFDSVSIMNDTFTITPETGDKTIVPGSREVTVRRKNVGDVDFFVERIWDGDYDTRDHNDSIEDLEGYTTVAGDLVIADTELQDLSGLESLVTVEGNFNLGLVLYLVQQLGNPDLSTLSGLNNLTNVSGYLSIRYSPLITSIDALKNIESLGSLRLSGLDSLTDVEPFNRLTTLNSLIISGNEALASLEGFRNITAINGTLGINNCDSLESLDGLENITSVCGLYLYNNLVLTSLSPLGNIVASLDYLQLSNNDVLTDLEGLNHITAIGMLDISGNPSLLNIDALNNLTAVGEISIRWNDALISIDAFKNITTVSSIYITGNDLLPSLEGLDNITTIDGEYGIDGESCYETSDPLFNMCGELRIDENLSLTALGLDNLEFVEDSVTITDNTELCGYLVEDLIDQLTCPITTVSNNKECERPDQE